MAKYPNFLLKSYAKYRSAKENGTTECDSEHNNAINVFPKGIQGEKKLIEFVHLFSGI